MLMTALKMSLLDLMNYMECWKWYQIKNNIITFLLINKLQPTSETRTIFCLEKL